MISLRPILFVLSLLPLLAAGFHSSVTVAQSERGEQTLFKGQSVPAPNDRLHTNSERDLRITTAVPSAEETKEIFGQNLYLRNIQPVWVQVENLGDQPLYLTPMGLDPAYYTAREVAERSRSSKSAAPPNEVYESRGFGRLRVPAKSIVSGYIFSRVDEGTKSFNIDVVGGAQPYMISFFVPVPGLRIDHYRVEIAKLYGPEDVREVDLAQLVAELETMPCCVRDKAGEDKGDPLNLVFIGSVRDMYYAFMRAGWDETETIYGTSLLKTAASALMGDAYRYSPVSALYVFGRAQDAAMQRARTSIHERNHLRVWITPLLHEGKPVWIGQISRDIGVHFTWRTITTHKIDPDVDETREFLLEDLAYAQMVSKFGYVGGVGPAPYDEPRGNLTGDPYFTDGQRIVIWVASNPTSIKEIEVLDLSPHQTGMIGD
jgi:LssY C-terminus